MRTENGALSRILPAALWHAVLAADGYACIWCKSRVALQVDHARPRAHGGTDSPRNLVTLCTLHNTVKSNYWVADDGYVFYRPWPRHDNKKLARRISRRALRLCRQRRRLRRLRREMNARGLAWTR
jgi:hypothetical protein